MSFDRIPILNWLLYTKDLRDVIRELREKDDFRPERLGVLHFRLLLVVLLGGAFNIVVVYIWLTDPLKSQSFDFFTFFLPLALTLVAFVKYRTHEPSIIIPYSIGKATTGLITKNSTAIVVSWGMIRLIRWVYKNLHGESVEGFTQVSIFWLGENDVDKGDSIMIRHAEKSRSYSMIFIEEKLDSYRISHTNLLKCSA